MNIHIVVHLRVHSVKKIVFQPDSPNDAEDPIDHWSVLMYYRIATYHY